MRLKLLKKTPARATPARRGAVLILLALILPVILVLAAFAVNLAYMELNRTELQISTDAASRAAGRDLNVTNNTAQALARAQQLAQLNPVAGKPLTLQASDVVFGVANRTSTTSRYTFTSGGTSFNAVQVTGCRNSSSTDGNLNMLFPGLLSMGQIGTTQTAQATQGVVDICLVVDHSGSMAFAYNESSNGGTPASAPPGWNYGDPVPPQSRWLDLVAGVNSFTTDLTNSACIEQLGLVSFNDTTQVCCQLSTNYSPIAPALNVYTQSFPQGSTAIGDGIIAGIAVVNGPNARPWAAKVIVVFTDGLSNTGTDPMVAAQQAANQNITIFTVTYSNEADQTGMTQVAQLTGGKEYHPATPADVAAVFHDIATKLPILLCH